MYVNDVGLHVNAFDDIWVVFEDRIITVQSIRWDHNRPQDMFGRLDAAHLNQPLDTFLAEIKSVKSGFGPQHVFFSKKNTVFVWPLRKSHVFVIGSYFGISNPRKEVKRFSGYIQMYTYICKRTYVLCT